MTTEQKVAKKEYDRKRYQDKRDCILKQTKLYQSQNAEAIKAYHKRYYEMNSDSIKEYQKKHYAINADSLKLKGKKYKADNAEYIKCKAKEYYKKNLHPIRIRNREYNKQRRKTDPIYRMIGCLRSRLYVALKEQGEIKDIKTKELCGESQEFVWKYLESLFAEGMTRENGGRNGWHIDHIIPISSFDLSDPEQLKACCHYTNLQPLWAEDNLKKSNKILKQSK